MRRWFWTVAAVSVTLSAFAACQGEEGGAGHLREDTPLVGDARVHVELDEWSVTPDETSAPAGPVTFVTENRGSMRHDLVVIRTDLAPEALPVSAATVDEEEAGQVVGVIKKFHPLLERSATLDLSAGKYVLICNVAGHYRLGMFAAMEIQ
jgi:uncharacterized cupredoxin-like copper-binding protein